MARFFVGRGEPQTSLDLLDRAERLCGEPALGDLAVELLSIRGTALLAIGRTGEARAITRRAAERLTPGVERPYLIQHWHAAAARATGSHSEARQATTEAHRLLELALAGLSPEERVQSLTRVPEHREIVAAATKIAPQTVEVLLPAVGAPTGRPLGDDETRLVVWTVDHPEDTTTDSPIDRRRRRLLRLLAEAGDQGAVPSIEQVAAALDVSDSTVRRDLAVLRESGHPITTRGQRRQVS
jgi:DNA-binding transcriptional ArsR family regulator